MILGRWMRHWKEALLQVCYPHHCLGCGGDALAITSYLCPACLHHLPKTNYHLQPNHHLQRMLEARLPVVHSTALWYFGKSGPLHNAIEALKYRRLPEVGVFLGMLMGEELKQYDWAKQIQAIVPLPLNARKQTQRGYNQAERIAQGIAQQLDLPVETNALKRTRFTRTQTRLGHLARWHNLAEVFALDEKARDLAGKTVLLIDDVITTGATIEHAGNTLLTIPGLKLCVASVAYTSHR